MSFAMCIQQVNEILVDSSESEQCIEYVHGGKNLAMPLLEAMTSSYMAMVESREVT